MDFKNDGPLEFRDFTVDITNRFGLVEFDSAERDSAKSFIVIGDARKYSVETDVTPNNGATYTVKVEECGGAPRGNGDDTGNGGTDNEDTGTAADDQYAPKTPPGPIDSPKGVMPGTGAKKVPNTGGPPIVLGALVLLGAALIVGQGVLRR